MFSGIFGGEKSGRFVIICSPVFYIRFWWFSHILSCVLTVILVCLGADLVAGTKFVFWGKYSTVYFMDVDTSLQESGEEPQLYVFETLPPRTLLLFGFKHKIIEVLGIDMDVYGNK